MVNRKKPKVVIVTGTSSGLGKSIVEKLSKLNFLVIACSRKKGSVSFKKKNIFFFKVNVMNEKQIKKLTNIIFKKFGRIDVLINNAGIAFNSKLEDINLKKMDNLFKTNLYAPFIFIKYCLPIMKKQNYGRIINISSGGSVNCAKNYSAYSASKAALNTVAKSLKNELDKYDIKINTLSPGPIKTKMFPKNKLSPKLSLPTLEYLINIDKNGPSGNFFWFKKKINIIPSLKIDWSKPKI